MVLNISEEEYQQMKGAVMDRDKDEAFRLVKLLVGRLEQQQRLGLKSHLDGH
jgi:hypothetical protein